MHDRTELIIELLIQYVTYVDMLYGMTNKICANGLRRKLKWFLTHSISNNHKFSLYIYTC